MICLSCGEYFKKNKFANPTSKNTLCEDCDGSNNLNDEIDEELSIDIQRMVNPSGRVKPIIYDDTDGDGL